MQWYQLFQYKMFLVLDWFPYWSINASIIKGRPIQMQVNKCSYRGRVIAIAQNCSCFQGARLHWLLVELGCIFYWFYYCRKLQNKKKIVCKYSFVVQKSPSFNILSLWTQRYCTSGQFTLCEEKVEDLSKVQQPFENEIKGTNWPIKT